MSEVNESVVQTIGLTKVFRDFWLREKVTAVADLELDIRTREVFGLLGPNGSGKSTTLKMILGLLFPTKGQIAVFGRRPTDVAIKAKIGFLPEESYLYPFLDAHETLDFYGRLFHQPRRERRRRTEMLLEMVGLSRVAYRQVGEYSKGMQRRIGLAQALINDPDLLILDEPTSGMDPIGTHQIKELIQTLAARGKTVILSSHLLADVEDVCDRVCILYGGRKRDQGTLTELLAQTGKTQLTSDRLDDETLAKVQAVITESGRQVHEVTAPTDKLESLFLRIVNEAQQQRVATGGALAGGEVAEFLRVGGQAEGEQVIDDLLAAARPSEPEPAPQPDEPEVVDQVIEELVTTGRQSTEPAPDEQPSQAPTPQVDRDVLGDLIDRAKSDKDKE